MWLSPKSTPIVYRGKKYDSLRALSWYLNISYDKIVRLNRRYGGNLDFLEKVERKDQGFLPDSVRKNCKLVRAWLRPCTCRSRRIYAENLKGEIKDIRCLDCGRTIYDFLIDNAILKWNKEYDEQNCAEL